MTWRNKLFFKLDYGTTVRNIQRQRKIWTHRVNLPPGRTFEYDRRQSLKGRNFIMSRSLMNDKRDEFLRMMKIK